MSSKKSKSKKQGCPANKVKVLNRCIPKNPNTIYIAFVKDAEKKGHDHTKLNNVVRNTFVATKAEIVAGKKFYKWVLEDPSGSIVKRYKIIGGKTWRAGIDMLFPAGLVEQRRGLNQHLWAKYKKVD